jgi:hypothetical protein
MRVVFVFRDDTGKKISDAYVTLLKGHYTEEQLRYEAMRALGSLEPPACARIEIFTFVCDVFVP